MKNSLSRSADGPVCCFADCQSAELGAIEQSPHCRTGILPSSKGNVASPHEPEGRAAVLRSVRTAIAAAQQRRPTKFRFMGAMCENDVSEKSLPGPLPIRWGEGKDLYVGRVALSGIDRSQDSFPSPHRMGRGALQLSANAFFRRRTAADWLRNGRLLGRLRYALTGLILGSFVISSNGQPAPTKETVDFKQVFDLLRSNLTETSEAELNQAAVSGLVDRFRNQVILVTNAPPSGSPLLSKTAVFDDAFAYVRVAQVSSGLNKEVRSAYGELSNKRKLSGLIVDLRFANGQDYGAATEAADLFFSQDQPLLKWSDTTSRSTVKTNAITLPVALLVNKRTAGSAEALAAALRQAKLGLVIGSPTAGQARVFRNFTLSNGWQLKIAADSIETGDGQVISGKGLTPDIEIAVPPEDEKAYFDDPYKAVPKLFAQSVKPSGTNEVPGLLGTNRPPRRRINESELIRMQREGIEIDQELTERAEDKTTKPVVYDPALARAIDFLKGVALVQSRR